MILTLTGNPCVDKTVFIDSLNAGQKIHGQKVDCVAGGKGCNVSKAVQRLGVKTHAALIVGGNSGQQVLDLMADRHNIKTTPLWVHSPTRTITTVLEERRHRQTPIFEPGSRITRKEYDTIIQQFINLVDELKERENPHKFFITFNGSTSDPSAYRLYKELMPKVKKRNAFIILDSHGKEFSAALQAAPHVIKPNLEEAEQALGFKINSPQTRQKAFDQFHQFGISMVIITLGKNGALASLEKNSHREQFRILPPTIKEINPVGSGDCFLAGIAVGLYQEMELKDCLRLAVAAGAANAATWDIGDFAMDSLKKFQAEVQLEEL